MWSLIFQGSTVDFPGQRGDDQDGGILITHHIGLIQLFDADY